MVGTTWVVSCMRALCYRIGSKIRITQKSIVLRGANPGLLILVCSMFGLAMTGPHGPYGPLRIGPYNPLRTGPNRSSRASNKKFSRRLGKIVVFSVKAVGIFRPKWTIALSLFRFGFWALR